MKAGLLLMALAWAIGRRPAAWLALAPVLGYSLPAAAIVRLGRAAVNGVCRVGGAIGVHQSFTDYYPSAHGLRCSGSHSGPVLQGDTSCSAVWRHWQRWLTLCSGWSCVRPSPRRIERQG